MKHSAEEHTKKFSARKESARAEIAKGKSVNERFDILLRIIRDDARDVVAAQKAGDVDSEDIEHIIANFFANSKDIVKLVVTGS